MNRTSHTSHTDEELLKLSAEGQKTAFEEIYNRYSGRIYNYFLRMNRNDSAKAQDLTQDLFLKIIQNQADFDLTRSFKTWIFSMANNMCKNIYRHQEVVKKADKELAYTQNNSVKMEPVHDKFKFKEALNQALNDLEPIKKSSFIMRYKQDMSIREIAEITKTSEGTVKSRLFYTLRQLSVSLKSFEKI
ncbi:RNA polymerase sigma factor [Cryomorpha ignava]|uniref:RNA polymerase sigma factor n=1 Tax=Cryomorpha ignava TaxID=101383 RepID=A0A7K3WRY0_9FLAO|nr:RNA polymerase sigma factor [Cryomorpha ignava]NEN24429.1 RNA polymerase sigma factor [Cryomorpha ignava]